MTNSTAHSSGAPLRCFIGGVQHESSSFSPIPTELRSFETCRWGVDPEQRTLGFGYGESCKVALELGFDLTTGPFSSCQPSLPAPHGVWEQVREGILAPLRSAGPVDIVRDADAGLVVGADPDSIGGALKRLVDDKAAARAMGERGRACVVARYGWPAVASRMEEVYRAAVGNRGPRS